jgi:endogenous inhibitor of DNA gyrase (YacG/DUF329 family)
MMRYGDHLNPPPRLPGETFEDWLSACQTAIVFLPERTSLEPRSETVHEPAVRPARVCALPGCGIVFNPRAAHQRCCSAPHREALSRAEGRRRQRAPVVREPSQLVPSICTVHKQEMRHGRPAAQHCYSCRKQAKRRAAGIQPYETRRVATIPCPICGTPFAPVAIGKGQRRKTCSTACGRALFVRTDQERRATVTPAPRRRQLADRRCEPCGKDFHPRRSTTRYCSATCRIAATRSTPDLARVAMLAATEARRLEKIPCPICGTLFAPVRAGKNGRVRVTCSVGCGQISRERKLRRAPRAPCPVCGTEVRRLVTRRPSQSPRERTFCSQACFHVALRQRQERAS